MLTQMQINMLAVAAEHDMQHIVQIYEVASMFGDSDTADYITQHYYSKFTQAQQQQVDELREAIASAENAAQDAYAAACNAATAAINKAAAH